VDMMDEVRVSSEPDRERANLCILSLFTICRREWEAGTGTGGQQGEIRGRVMEGEQGGRTCTAA
jgi:hypothetical protein